MSEQPGPSLETHPAPPFFAVSIPKLLVMSICTVGLYPIYWFYRNWQGIRDRAQTDLLPIPRAVFAVVFCYSCFRRMKAHAAELGAAPRFSPGWLAVGWIVSDLIDTFPLPLGLLGIAGVFFLLPVQRAANRANALVVPDHDPNSRFSLKNMLWIVFGLTLLAFEAYFENRRAGF